MNAKQPKRKINLPIVDIVSTIVSIFAIIFLENSVSSLPFIGILIILTSLYMIFKYRKSGAITLLIGILTLISISFAYSVCLNTQSTAFNWQIPLINTESNIVNAKNFLLFLSILSLSIGKIRIKEKETITAEKAPSESIAKSKYVPVMIVGCVLILLYALIFGFDRGTIGSYASNTNVIYEYALIVFIFAWQYTKNNKAFKIFLIIYAILYCSQGLLFGDRSSCFPMILAMLILNSKNNIKMKYVLIVGFLGILSANIIDIFRNTGDLFSASTLQETLSRGLFVNTISYSFYGGTQILRYGLSLSTGQRLTHMLNYASSFITGGSNKYNLTVMADAAGFLNKGGGLSSNYFYFWGGFIGVIIFAIIIGRIINYVFSHNSKLCDIFKITLTIFSIRWFVYYPTAFFRTALFVPLVGYYISKFFSNRIHQETEKLAISERTTI
ncbi:hypothetical protein IKL45_03655 [Candidatus Saccharibacteria bacterium]|nr:hypothetical protein [Candidatus Saccharibacteria bacterium]MBR6122251.1 hypothetical protein [Candidatus Saccharibacteria bacterium]